MNWLNWLISQKIRDLNHNVNLGGKFVYTWLIKVVNLIVGLKAKLGDYSSSKNTYEWWDYTVRAQHLFFELEFCPSESALAIWTHKWATLSVFCNGHLMPNGHRRLAILICFYLGHSKNEFVHLIHTSGEHCIHL